jgi:hypothetical protein
MSLTSIQTFSQFFTVQWLGGSTRSILRLSLPRLNTLFSHGLRPVNPVQLVVEAARVANGLTLVVPPPQGRVLGAAVGAAETQSS